MKKLHQWCILFLLPSLLSGCIYTAPTQSHYIIAYNLKKTASLIEYSLAESIYCASYREV